MRLALFAAVTGSACFSATPAEPLADVPLASERWPLPPYGGAKWTSLCAVQLEPASAGERAIGNAAGRGVTVRVIVEDPNDTTQNAGVAAFMAARGIPVKYAVQQFYLHAKLLIADGVAFVGSENMSTTSMTQNREMGALVFEPDQVAVIQQQFDADWAITTPAM